MQPRRRMGCSLRRQRGAASCGPGRLVYGLVRRRLRRGAQIDACDELFGQVRFVVGLVGVEEGRDEGGQGLVVCGIAGFCVLFGFGAPGLVNGGRACWFSVEPPEVAQYPLVAAFPHGLIDPPGWATLSDREHCPSGSTGGRITA